MNPRDEAKARMALLDARRAWALDEQWDIQIKWVDNPNVLIDEDGTPTDIGISLVHWPSKKATLEISTSYDMKNIYEDTLHELGHILTAYLWRAATDYLDNIPETKEGTLARKIITEAWNTNENFVIDHLVFQVLLRERRNG